MLSARLLEVPDEHKDFFVAAMENQLGNVIFRILADHLKELLSSNVDKLLESTHSWTICNLYVIDTLLDALRSGTEIDRPNQAPNPSRAIRTIIDCLQGFPSTQTRIAS